MEKTGNEYKACSRDEVNFHLTLRRFSIFGDDAANAFDGRVFRKIFEYAGALFLLSIYEKDAGVYYSIGPDPAGDEDVLQEAKRLVGQILGLQFSLPEFYAFAKSDPIIHEHVRQFQGLRPTLSATGFEMLVTSITAQQINLKFAFTTRSRMIRKFGKTFEKNGAIYYVFPTPERLADAKIEQLREMQFSNRKAEYVIGLARSIVHDGLNLEGFTEKQNDEVFETLMPLRGIGRWSVDWFLARYLGRGEAFPSGDLAVRKLVEKHFFDSEKRPEDELRRFAQQRWGKFTNLVVHYLLAGLS